MDETLEEDEVCYICDYGNGDVLETHHILPRRYGGLDTEENTVDLCPTCHEAVERIYDQRFWRAVEMRLAQYAVEAISELQVELEKQRQSSERTSIADSVRMSSLIHEAEQAKQGIKEL